MKRILTTSFVVLALLISAAGAAPAAYAQGIPVPADAGPIDLTGQDLGPLPTTPAGETVIPVPPVDTTATIDPAAAATPIPFAATLDSESAFGSIMIFIMKLFAWLLGVAAITLDNVVYYTVVTMGDYIHHLAAVGVAWRILRDIGNIMLIFGFLAIGITTILNVNWYGTGTKMLPMLLIAAVFLNFSLFISEAVIDTGNLFATQFYTQINGGVPAAPINYFDTGSIRNEGISNKVMSQLRLATIYGQALTNNVVYKAGSSVLIGFMSIIVFLVAAFVMFSLAFILIARFVILLFLIILAPIGFAGLAVPQLAARAKRWWDLLFEQTITAPVLLLMLYIALAIITDIHFLGFGPSGDWSGFIPNADGTTNYTGFASMLLSFIVAMGLLIAVTIQAKKLSAYGADVATGLAGKLTFGATAFAARRTVGRASNAAARSIRASKYARNDLGKLFAGIADRGAKASFDVRGATIAGGLKGLGVAAGEAQKGGYHGREEELMKDRIEYAKTLRQTKTERTNTEEAKLAQEKLVGAHNTAMEAFETQEQDQLRKVREAKTKAQKEVERDKVEEIRNKIALEKNSHQTKMSKQEEIIKENSAAAVQKQYGTALRSKNFLGVPFLRVPYDWSTAVGSARREASSRIIGEANKDPLLKKLDEIGDMTKKNSASSGGGAAPSAPAAPAPH